MCAVSTLFLGFAWVGNAQEMAKGFGFLGLGYDLLQGNPLDTSGEGDLGFRSPVFQLSTKGKKTTPDGKYLIPDHTRLLATPTCSMNQSNGTFNNTDQYRKSVNFSFGLNGSFHSSDLIPGIEGASFNFNINTKNVKAHTADNEHMFVLESFVCTTYQLHVDAYDIPDFTKNFKIAVMMMPTEYDEDNLMMFLSNFGTHIITDVGVGGRWGLQSSFKKSDVRNMQDKGLDFNIGASVAAKISAGFHISDASSTYAASQVSSITESQTNFNIGGNFSADPKEWHDSVISAPMPVTLRRMPIHMYLNTMFFPDDADIKTKYNLLKQAEGKYCEYLRKTVDNSVSCPQTVEAPIITV